MSKIQEINSKIINKLESTTWKDILIPYIKSEPHTKLMEKLMADAQQKIVFEPPLKEWFREFEKPLLTIDTVIVSDDYKLPFEVKENELHLVVNKTLNPNEKHGELWKDFNHTIIKSISKMNMVFVFVGKESYQFVKYIGENKKFLMPNATDKFWEIESLVADYNTKKENVLKRALVSK